MKTKVLSILLTGGIVAFAAWVVYAPNPAARAYEIPEKYRETVHKGLEYLAKNQFKDGHWASDGGDHPVAMTGLVGLAMLMDKETKVVHGDGEMAQARKYAANIDMAVEWLMKKSEAGRSGIIFSEHPSETARYMEGHGFATLFMAGVLHDAQDEARRKRLSNVLTGAVNYIAKAQSTQGGWHHTSKTEGHDFDIISATIIQIQALQAAENAGISIPSETINDGKAYLKKYLSKYEEGGKRDEDRNRLADAASALIGLFNDEHLAKDVLDETWFKHCQAQIATGRAIELGRNDLIHYYFAQVVFNLGGDVWKSYRTALFDHLQSSQNKDGSWPSSSGIGIGQVYATALWCSILQLDRRSHPSRRRLPLGVD